MSVATEFAPDVYIPPQARPGGDRLATVITLHAPCDPEVPVRVRATRRGAAVLGVVVLALAGSLIWLAAVSAPSAPSSHRPAPATVTVRGGDTLWAIATRVAPDRDPRAEVAALQRLNNLAGVDVVAGQVLRTR